MNLKTIDKNIAELLTCLESSNIEDILEHSNIFIPSLILLALYPAKAHKTVTTVSKKLLDFVTTNKSSNWTWNYWPRSEALSGQNSYPDDLDDTCCAVAAITQWSPTSIDGGSMMHITKTLFMNESTPGGPYFTWIVHGQRKSELQDIDIAVNANISFMLSHFDVQLPELNEYIDSHIRMDNFDSVYYHNPLVTLYFISRNYLGNERNLLIQLITKRVRPLIEDQTINKLDLALATSSLIRLGAEDTVINECMDCMFNLTVHEESRLQPIYRERITGDFIHYAYSELFTISVTLEAYTLFRNTLESKENKTTPAYREKVQTKILERLRVEKKYFSSRMWHIIDKKIARYRNSSIWDEITILPSSLLRTEHDTSIQYLCGLYSLLGWISYSIDDDMMDEDSDDRVSTADKKVSTSNHLIPLSRYLHRFMSDLLHNEILPIARPADRQNILKYVQKILNTTDNTHNIEAAGRHVSIVGKSFCMALPSMVAVWVHLSDTEVAEEIRGHVMSALGGALHHYVCARQISDDAHDWQEDMRSDCAGGRGNYHNRATSLTKRIFSISSLYPDKSLKDIFWNQCAKDEATKILEHVEHAKRLALKCQQICPQVNTNFLIERITKYETTAEKLITAVDRTKQFISSYKEITSTKP